MSLVTPTFTYSPSTLGTDEMVYTPDSTIDLGTSGSAKFLIYADTSAWLDFRLQVVDTTTYTAFTSYETLTDGYALMAKLEYDTSDAGTAIASTETFGQCISNSDTDTYITCWSCTAGATVDSSITASDLTCTTSYQSSTVSSNADAVSTLTSVTDSGDGIYGFSGLWYCSPSVTSGIVSVQCHVFQPQVADSASGNYRFDPTTLTTTNESSEPVKMWVHTTTTGLYSSDPAITAADWKSAIQSFTFASAALALASFHLF